MKTQGVKNKSQKSKSTTTAKNNNNSSNSNSTTTTTKNSSSASANHSIENTNSNKFILTIPNLISTLRIILIVIAAKQLYLNTISSNINAFALYVTAMFTDFFDGYLARKLNKITELGKILDPVADKLMIGSAVLILFLQNRMPLWFVLVVVLRDVLILLGGVYVRSKIHFVLPSICVGKATAVLLMITFGLNILNVFFIDYLYYISAVFCVASLIVYALNAQHKLKIKNKLKIN